MRDSERADDEAFGQSDRSRGEPRFTEGLAAPGTNEDVVDDEDVVDEDENLLAD